MGVGEGRNHYLTKCHLRLDTLQNASQVQSRSTASHRRVSPPPPTRVTVTHPGDSHDRPTSSQPDVSPSTNSLTSSRTLSANPSYLDLSSTLTPSENNGNSTTRDEEETVIRIFCGDFEKLESMDNDSDDDLGPAS